MSHEASHRFNSLSPDKYFRANQSSQPYLDTSNLREIGDEALSWELSSAKSGHGVQQLRDDNITTFWQSDGMVPHKVEILFHKKQEIQSIAIHTDYKLDESYTPKAITIKASSSSMHNFENHIVTKKTLKEPSGWILLSLRPHKRQNEFDKYLKTNKIIFEIESSHQSGRDTHIRQIKIYAPNQSNNNNANKSLLTRKQFKCKNNGIADMYSDDDENFNPYDADFIWTERPKKKHKRISFKTTPFKSRKITSYDSIR